MTRPLFLGLLRLQPVSSGGCTPRAFEWGAVKFCVLGRGESHEVLGRIVQRVAINVVDLLTRAKATTVRLLPYNTVFESVAVMMGEMMAGPKHEHAGRRDNYASALPAWPVLHESPGVSADKAHWVTGENGPGSMGEFSDCRLAPTPTLAKPTSYRKVSGDRHPMSAVAHPYNLAARI